MPQLPQLPKKNDLAAMLQANAKPKENLVPHIVVNAGAGTGKTTTIVEGINRRLGVVDIKRQYTQEQHDIFDAMCDQASSNVAVVSYSKSIITDVSNRLPKGIEARTLHSFGWRTVLRNFPVIERGDVNSLSSALLAAKSLFGSGEMKYADKSLVKTALPLLDMAKATLTPPGEGYRKRLENLARRFGLQLPKTADEQTAQLDVVEHLLSCPLQIAESGLISYADMIWLCVALDLEPVTVYDLLCVDESQDLSACQRSWVLLMGRRKMIVGDPNQSIGNWNGSLDNAIAETAKQLARDKVGCEHYTLTMTRRCSKAVVKLANRIVTDYYAHHENEEGCIYFKDYFAYVSTVRHGDFVLARTNAPLILEYYQIAAEGLEVCVVGKKYGIHLVNICYQLSKSAILIESITSWYLEAMQRVKKDDNEAKYRLVEDYACLVHFVSRIGSANKTLRQLISAIEQVFVDEPQPDKVSLMTVHRSKGLEANNVFLLLLEKSNNWLPYGLAYTPAQLAEERRLEYVAITRARVNFAIVSDNLGRALEQFTAGL